ncbi:metallophosphoesterase [Chloroflexota bacterium]
MVGKVHKNSPATIVLVTLLLIYVGFVMLSACGPAPAPATQSIPSSATETYTPPPTATQPLSSTPPHTPSPSITPLPSDTPTASMTPTPEGIQFAVIGDYGQGEQAEQDVANLVKSWSPQFVITVGDNNYPSGAPETIDQNVGQFYQEFIYPYTGQYGPGAQQNRFFPTLGNHDWDINAAQAYFDYFSLPGNERYYDFVYGPVHFFALSSDSREPDGVGASTGQALWLKERLATSTAPWKLVYGHHPPYSSGPRGPVDWMRWPFKDWGATIYLAGHDHYYERLELEGFPYIINGLGGGPIYAFGDIAEGSLVRYNAEWGAMLVFADRRQITFQFINRQGQVIDYFELTAENNG